MISLSKLDYNKKMIRPGSAFVSFKPKPVRNIKSNNLKEHDFNVSKDAIVHLQNNEHISDIFSQNINEIKSANDHNKKEMDKIQLTAMLMQLELEKMGFLQGKNKAITRKFLQKKNLEEIELKNLKRWVMNKKSQLVQELLNSQAQNEHSEESIPMQNLNYEIQPSQAHKIMIKPIENSQDLEDQREVKHSEEANVINMSTKITINQSNNSNKPTVLCPICLMETSQYLVRNCGHYSCIKCFKSYIQQNIHSGNYIIECPFQQCLQRVKEDQASKLLEPEKLSRFIRFKSKIELESDPNNKFCNRLDCENVLTEVASKKLLCNACQIIFCELCLEPDHSGKLCNQAIKDSLNQTFNTFKIKKCPTCSSPIQKIDGCNHMTCKKCKAQFCWICLQAYSPYHYRFYNCFGCPGLQFEDVEEMGYMRFLQILFYIFLPALIVLLLFAIIGFLPLYIIANLIINPCRWLQEDYEKCQLEILKYICCCMPECIVLFFSYFIFLPRSILYAIFISPWKYFMMVGNFIYDII